MIKTNLSELKKIGQAFKGSIIRIYLHWTAGRYEQTFNDYHINITGDGGVYLSTYDLSKVLAHTWRRNTGAIGIALCCAYNAEPDSLGLPTGKYPPTTEQVEVMAKVVATLTDGLGLSINKQNIMTHAEAALIDGYGYGSGDPETRWDLYMLKDYDGIVKPGGDVLRGKAIWYKQQN